MTQEDFFYRRLTGAVFIHDNAASQRPLLAVRFANEFIPQDMEYDFSSESWQPLHVAGKTAGALAAGAFQDAASSSSSPLLCEAPEYPHKPRLSPELMTIRDSLFSENEGGEYCIEDLTVDQLKAYLALRAAFRRYRLNLKHLQDENGISRECFACTVTTDDKELLLDIQTHSFKEKDSASDGDGSRLEIVKKSLRFDMKSGTVLPPESDMDFDADFPAELEGVPSDSLQWFTLLVKELQIPENVLFFAYSKLLGLAELFTGVSFASRLDLPERLRKSPSGDKLGQELLRHMFSLTTLPFCPELVGVLENEDVRNLGFQPDRSDPEVFARFCAKAGIRNCPTVRKAFLADAGNLVTCFYLKEAGFTDINLFQKVLARDENRFVFTTCDIQSLRFFCGYSIRRRGELCTMNTLLRPLKSGGDSYEITDGIAMFHLCFSDIPSALLDDILYDGFTRFNHDALSNLTFKKKNRNLHFTYSKKVKQLEDVIDGYSFRLPENSWQLCDIGTQLHNCVASYAERIRKKQCTVVYAEKEGRLRLCIEVRGKTVVQELTDHNGRPNKQEVAILESWHKRHGLEVDG